MCCRNGIAVFSLTAASMAKATVGFDDLVCRPSESKICSSSNSAMVMRSLSRVLFLLLQLLLMVMLVVMLMVGSLTIWSVNR